MPAIYNFPNHVQGDSFYGANFTIEADGTPFDLTGSTLSFEFRYFDYTGKIVKTLTPGSGINVTDAVAGKFSIDPFEVDFPVGRSVYRCLITSSGNPKTFFAGYMKVKAYTNEIQLSASMTPDEITVNVAEVATGGAVTPVSVAVSGAETYAIAADKLAQNFAITPTEAGEIRIGTTLGGDELFSTTATDTSLLFADIVFLRQTAATLYFTGNFNLTFTITNYA